MSQFNYYSFTYGIDEETVKKMWKNGDLTYTRQYHWEIFNFYAELLKTYKGDKNAKTNALNDTLVHYNISRAQMYDIKRKFASSSL